jgi:hypothetical protein
MGQDEPFSSTVALFELENVVLTLPLPHRQAVFLAETPQKRFQSSRSRPSRYIRH